ncbi:alpha/beta fold hydrolase [Nocardioides humilatus]|uniref:Alpha/beta fold hydrolase n=1 Tax=Nocardioides humilatus TaxID=2607660 RepID=A0A5B1LPG7_9ACTN|nr:alpha/beta fold hydrolase [Nocardioides humilatus]KAA1421938.1 alpha/beta fold hydrolase [Nocardioides humilatus]
MLRRFRMLAVVPLVLALLSGGSGADATEDRAAAPGPKLRTDRAALAAAFACTDNIGTSHRRAVLLVHGTGAVPDENFAWNYYDKLRQQGHPYCTITIPDRGMGDLQVNVEYVVFAIRQAYRLSGREIAVIGHSQGAFLPSYALRMWPDLAGKVEDFISYAGAITYGTDQGALLCSLPCAEAFSQFTPGSNLLTELAKHPLPKGVSYTSFFTQYDEIVTPQPKASTIVGPGARNYLLQDLCPLDLAEHLLIIAEKPFFQLAFDALHHRGPGRLARVGKVACGFDPQVIRAVPALPTFGLGILTDYPADIATEEPPLRGYWRR